MRTLKKLAAAFLIMMLAASSAFAVVYGQAGYETEGYDESSAWEIDTADTLIKVRDDIYSGKINTEKYYRLTADIDLTGYRDWIPIGPDEDEWNYDKTPFNGVFDGGNHTIKVNIARTNQTYTGLFGVVSGGTIKNLKVTGRVLVSNRSTGYAWSGGYNSYVGGIAAYVLGGRIENCTFDGTITGTHSDYYDMYVGGIAGANRWDETVITNCKVGGKDSSTKIKSSAPGEHSYASGIIGYFTDYSSGNEISNNYSRVTLEAGIKQNRIYAYRDGTSGRVFGNSDVAPGGADPDDSDQETIEAVSIITTYLDEAFLGQEYSATVIAAGTAPIEWLLFSGSLPDGLTLDYGGNITGTPTKAGTYGFTLTASNASTNDARTFSITVTDLTTAPSITSSSYLGSFAVGDIATIQLYADGTTPITWSVAGGSLPTGLSLSTDGKLYGTISAAGSYSFTLRATNSKGYDSRTFTLDVTSPTITIGTDSQLPDAAAGEDYYADFYAWGDNLPYYDEWEWSATNLPAGLDMDSDGYIYGTPTEAGTYNFPVTAKNGNYSATKTFTLTVNAAEVYPPEIITSSLPDGRVSKSYEYQLEANSNTDVTWSVSGLPAGLYADDSGYIYGTPTAAGAFIIAVTAENDDGGVSRSYTLNISALGGIPIDAEHFPDDNFREYVSSNLDPDSDLWLDEDELAAVSYINIYGIEAESVEGIEYFTELTNLTVWSNNLTEIDLSKNTKLTYLDCDYNQLTELDLSHNTALETVYCQGNSITELDLSANTSLRALYCNNNQLTALDLSNNAALETLSCHSNHITALDLSNNPELSSPSLSDQNTEPFTVSKNAGSAYYTVNIAGILGGNLANVNPDTVRSNSENAAVYDAETGEASFYSLPGQVIYDYNTNAVNDAQCYMTVNIYPADEPTIITQTLPNATQDSEYSATIEALTKLAVTWDITVGYLPDGLELDTDTGEISGTPELYGTYSFTVTAYASSENEDGEISDEYEVSKSFTLTVNPPAETVIAPVIITDSVPDGKVGESYSALIYATGTSVNWAVSGLANAGLSWRPVTDGDSQYIIISGVCNEARTYSFSVTASNSAGNDPRVFSITFAGSAPVITTSSMQNAHIGDYYTAAFTARSSSAVTWEFSGTLPDGLLFDDGVLSGTPTEEGTFSFTVTASNEYGSDEKSYTLKVNGDAPAITTVSLDKGRANEYYTATFTATGSTPVTWSWSGTLPDGMTFTPDNGTLSGTPTVQNSYTFSVIATNEYGTDSKTFTLVIQQSRAVAPTIKTAYLPAGTVNVPYTAALSADGTAPITWTVSGDIPAGLTLSESGTLSGTPTEAGVFTLNISAANAARTVSKSFTLTINGIAPVTASSDKLPDGSVGVEYSAVLSADGTAPITWSIFGSLPAGLSLDASSGRIFGTPTEAGNFNLSVTASNIAGRASGRRSLTIRASVPAITTESLPAGLINTSYDAVLSADGTAPIIWNAVGNLPKGLALNSDGVISGKPAVSGSFDIRITATNTAGTDSKDFTIYIEGTAPTIRITGEQSGYVGREYSAVIATTGTQPVTISVTEGKLPDGLTLNQDNHTISGTFTAKGEYTFTLTASNVAGSASRPFTITVYEPVAPTIKTGRLPDAYKDEEYKYQLEADGANLKWTVAEGYELPMGLTLDEDGLLFGPVDAEPITHKFRVIVSNENGSKEKTFSLRVKSGTPTFRDDALKKAKWNKKYTYTLKLTNFKATVWTLVGDLPEGIKFSKGKFSGKPTECGDFEITVIAGNGAVEIAQDYEFVVEGIEPKLRGSFKKGTEGKAYTSTLKAQGTTPITWDFDALPAGLDFTTEKDGEVCTISGTPTEAFSSKIKVTISNGSGDDQTYGKGLKMTIKAIKPKFATSASELANLTVGTYFECDLKLSDSPTEVEWSCSGKLPKGITFDENSGRVYGTPEEAGRFAGITFTAKNASKLTYKAMLKVVMTVSEAGTPESASDTDDENAPEFVNGVAYYERGELSNEMLATIANSDEVIAAVLPAVEVEEANTYEFTVSLDRAVPEGGVLVWHSFPNGENDENDPDNAIFLDEEDETIERVPETYTVTVSAWLEPGVIYEPVIAVRIKD